MKQLIAFSGCTWPDILLRGERIQQTPVLPSKKLRDLRIRSCDVETLDLGSVEEVFNLLEINDCDRLTEIVGLPATVEYLWILNCPALQSIRAWGAAHTIRIGFCESLDLLPQINAATRNIQIHRTGLRLLPPVKGFCRYPSELVIELSENPALLFLSQPEDLKAHWEQFWTCYAWMQVLKEDIIAASMHPVRVARALEMVGEEELDRAL